MRHKAALLIGLALGWALCSCAGPGQKVRKTSDAYSRYMKGLLEDRLGDIEEAAQHYRQAQDLDDQAPAPHLQLGLDYIRLKRFKEAVSEFEKVLRLSPEDEYARYVLALLYIQSNDYKRAADQYEKLLEKNIDDRTQNIQLRRILSQLYFLDQDTFLAKKHAQEILKADPLDTTGLYFLAMIAGEEGDIPKAIEGFKEVLLHDPDDADAANSLAYLYAEQETELAGALGLAERAVQSDPANSAFLDTFGWVYFKMGDTDKAVEYLKKASQLAIDPVIYNHLAEAYFKKGMVEEARKSWTSSLSLDPAQKDIRDRLKAIGRP